MFASNFWYYVFFIIIILHLVIGFIYLIRKLSPKKENKKMPKKKN